MTLSQWLSPASEPAVPQAPQRTGYDYPYSPAGGHGKGGGGGPAMAMSALTLLAFLFFLNILQNCLRDSVAMSSTPGGGPVLVVPQVPATATGSRYRRQRGDGAQLEAAGREDMELQPDVTSGTEVASPATEAASPATEAERPATEAGSPATEAAATDSDDAWVRIDAQS